MNVNDYWSVLGFEESGLSPEKQQEVMEHTNALVEELYSEYHEVTSKFINKHWADSDMNKEIPIPFVLLGSLTCLILQHAHVGGASPVEVVYLIKEMIPVLSMSWGGEDGLQSTGN